MGDVSELQNTQCLRWGHEAAKDMFEPSIGHVRRQLEGSQSGMSLCLICGVGVHSPCSRRKPQSRANYASCGSEGS